MSTKKLYREQCLDTAGNRFVVVITRAPDLAGGVGYALEDGTPVVPADPGTCVIPETGKFLTRLDEPDAGA